MELELVVQPSSPIDRILFETELVTIGAFRCPRHHPLFADSGPIEHDLFALAVEELVVMLLERVVELSFGTQARATPGTRQRARSDLVHRVERLLSERPTDALRLTEVAREVGSSVHHICRAFRSQTGLTMHQYRHQLRLRSSLELVRRTDRPLVRIALELGFSSHSHFTSAFRRGFGLPPSRLRSAPSKSLRPG